MSPDVPFAAGCQVPKLGKNGIGHTRSCPVSVPPAIRSSLTPCRLPCMNSKASAGDQVNPAAQGLGSARRHPRVQNPRRASTRPTGRHGRQPWRPRRSPDRTVVTARASGAAQGRLAETGANPGLQRGHEPRQQRQRVGGVHHAGVADQQYPHEVAYTLCIDRR